MKNTKMNKNVSLQKKVVSIYQDRYPKLFSIDREEAKDCVKFVFNAEK